MTALDQPCSDTMRRLAFSMFRHHGIRDHHSILPWAGVESMSRASGVTEGEVRMLTAWVEAGRPTSVHAYLARDAHRVVTYLDGGDVEFATLTEREYRAMTEPRRPPPGRIRLKPAPAPAPAPVAPVVVDVVPVPPTPTPVTTGRPVGRIRLNPKAAPAVAAIAPVVDLSTGRYVGPCLELEREWSGRGREPHGPPCPLDLHAMGDLSWWGGPGFRA